MERNLISKVIYLLILFKNFVLSKSLCNVSSDSYIIAYATERKPV